MRMVKKKIGMTRWVYLVASGVVVHSLPAMSLQVISQQDLTIAVDTTLTVGTSWRASAIDYNQVGSENAIAAGHATHHRHNSSAGDNANLRFKKDSVFSQVYKGVVDIQAEYKDHGAFLRGKYFYDDAIVKGDGGTDLPAYYPQDNSGDPMEPRQEDGKGGEILDAFIWTNWNIFKKSVQVRAGKQVINWGEGVLFANGINTANPVDVSALLTPGAELKEALIPVKMLHFSLGITDSLRAEGFYQFEWEKTRLPPCGTFFNTTDLVGPGCSVGVYGFGREPGLQGFNPDDPNQDVFRLARGADIRPDDGDEFGFSTKYYLDAIETEFGAYYVRYNSRLPIVGATAPPADARIPFPLGLPGRLSTMTLNVFYPEDIKLFGLSFNTNVDFGLPGGETAIAGEISYRRNQPFQIEDSVLLSGMIGLPSQLCHETGFDCDIKYPDQQFVDGSISGDFYQAEISFVHMFVQALGADRWVALLDVAYDHAGIPPKSTLLMNSAYNADLVPSWSAISSDSPFYALSTTHESKYYPTPDSWGYKLRISGEYNNVLAGINLVPTVSFSQDVSGVTPDPVGNFLEDRKSLGLSLEANYLSNYKVEVGYTDYFGAEPYNQMNDRDFYSVSASAWF